MMIILKELIFGNTWHSYWQIAKWCTGFAKSVQHFAIRSWTINLLQWQLLCILDALLLLLLVKWKLLLFLTIKNDSLGYCGSFRSVYIIKSKINIKYLGYFNIHVDGKNVSCLAFDVYVKAIILCRSNSLDVPYKMCYFPSTMSNSCIYINYIIVLSRLFLSLLVEWKIAICYYSRTISYM